MIWHIENYRRFKREREALEALAARVEWLTPLGWRIDSTFRVVWDADISVPAGNRPITLIYPNHFPFSPPLVVPRGDKALDKVRAEETGPYETGGPRPDPQEIPLAAAQTQ